MLLIAAAIPLTVYVASQQQELRKRASDDSVALAPYVAISSPQSNSVITDATKVAVAILNNARVVGVEYYLDEQLTTKLEKPPFVYQLADTSSLAPGVHRITVRAIDDNANVGVKTITVYK